MNRTVESALRFVSLTTSGLLAGSLGFGGAALALECSDLLANEPHGPRVALPLKPPVTTLIRARGADRLAPST